LITDYGLAIKESLDRKFKRLRAKDKEMLRLIEKKVNEIVVKAALYCPALMKSFSAEPFVHFIGYVRDHRRIYGSRFPMIHNLKIFLFGTSFEHWSKTVSNIESEREVRESIDIVTEDASMFITIIPRIPYLMGLFITFFSSCRIRRPNSFRAVQSQG
jgi:hypothetical protein